jgi:hypothetical protein
LYENSLGTREYSKRTFYVRDASSTMPIKYSHALSRMIESLILSGFRYYIFLKNEEKHMATTLCELKTLNTLLLEEQCVLHIQGKATTRKRMN